MAATPKDTIRQIEYYATALKAPRIRDSAARLADQARDAGWTHEEYLSAVLSREVSSRESSGWRVQLALPDPRLGLGHQDRVLGGAQRPNCGLYVAVDIARADSIAVGRRGTPGPAAGARSLASCRTA